MAVWQAISPGRLSSQQITTKYENSIIIDLYTLILKFQQQRTMKTANDENSDRCHKKKTQNIMLCVSQIGLGGCIARIFWNVIIFDIAHKRLHRVHFCTQYAHIESNRNLICHIYYFIFPFCV